MNMTDFFAALAGVPRLPGAACVGRHTLFDPRALDDPDRPDTEARALSLCRSCRALAGCEAWFFGLPPKQRPHGVIAGRVNYPAEAVAHPRGRPRNHHGDDGGCRKAVAS